MYAVPGKMVIDMVAAAVAAKGRGATDDEIAALVESMREGATAGEVIDHLVRLKT